MAKYEQVKDKELYRTETNIGNDVRIVATVFQYDGGTPKIQLHREVFTAEGDSRFQKLGRLEPTAFHAVLSMLNTINSKNKELGWWADDDCKVVVEAVPQ